MVHFDWVAQAKLVKGGSHLKHIGQIGPHFGRDFRFGGPHGVSLSPSGDILVADDLDHAIYFFDPEGHFLRKMGRKGNKPGQFAYLDDVKSGPDGLLYVADTGNNRIQLLDFEGTYKGTIEHWGLLGLQSFSNPRSLAFDHHDRLYVADWGNHAVRIFSKDGVFLQTIGGQGKTPGKFDSPITVFVNSEQGKLYVSDFKNHRVQVFDLNGAFLYEIGNYGDGPGQLINPVGLAMDNSGHLYVADRGNHRISIFDQNGGFITIFGSKGSADGQFETPAGIAFDGRDRIYIVDKGNHSIQILGLSRSGASSN